MSQEDSELIPLSQIINQLKLHEIQQLQESQAFKQQLETANQKITVQEQAQLQQKQYYQELNKELFSLCNMVDIQLSSNLAFGERLNQIKNIYSSDKSLQYELESLSNKKPVKDKANFINDEKLIMQTLKEYSEIFEPYLDQLKSHIIESTDSEDYKPKIKKSKRDIIYKSDRVEFKDVSKKKAKKLITPYAKHSKDNKKKVIQDKHDFVLKDCRIQQDTLKSDQIQQKTSSSEKRLKIQQPDSGFSPGISSNNFQQYQHEHLKIEQKIDMDQGKNRNIYKGEIRIKDCREKQNEQINQQAIENDKITGNNQFLFPRNDIQTNFEQDIQLDQSTNQYLDLQGIIMLSSEEEQETQDQSIQIQLESFEQARQNGTRSRGGKNNVFQNLRQQKQEKDLQINEQTKDGIAQQSRLIQNSEDEVNPVLHTRVQEESFEEARQNGTRTRGGKKSIIHNGRQHINQNKMIINQTNQGSDKESNNNQSDNEQSTQIQQETFDQARQNGTRTRGGKSMNSEQRNKED